MNGYRSHRFSHSSHWAAPTRAILQQRLAGRGRQQRSRGDRAAGFRNGGNARSADFPRRRPSARSPIPTNCAFWNATNGVSALDGYPSTGPNLNIPNMSGVLHATAWYTLPGGDGHGPPVLRARTFDIDLNNFRKETPIASATPAGAWPGPRQSFGIDRSGGRRGRGEEHIALSGTLSQPAARNARQALPEPGSPLPGRSPPMPLRVRS